MRARVAAGLLSIYACGTSADAETTRGELPPQDADGGPIDGPGDRSADAAARPDARSDAGDGSPLYSETIQKSVHNAYEREEPLVDQLVRHRVRSLELDIHNGKLGSSKVAGDWFVYHVDVPLLNETSCAMLSDCLGQVAAFGALAPHHEVVTLFVDLKTSFEAGRQVADLDALLSAKLGTSLFTPADLVARCPGATDVRDAVRPPCAFPTLAELRGRVLVAVTGGSACDDGALVNQYAGSDPSKRAAFAAPNVDSSGCTLLTAQMRARPSVFVNMSWDDRLQTSEARASGIVPRLYDGGADGGLDDPTKFDEARTIGVLHLATDKVNEDADPWSRTRGALGFPFECPGCDDTLAEDAPVVGVSASGGDIGGASDSFFFAYEVATGAAEYESMISVPSSHTEKLAKGCLMARASDAPGAPSAALCRPFDDGPVRFLVRAAASGSTASTDAPSVPGLVDEAVSLVRMTITPAGGGVEVAAAVSADGSSWLPVGTASIDDPLELRGLAVAASGASGIAGLFLHPTRMSAGGTRVLDAASVAPGKAIGAKAGGKSFDGPFP